MYIHTCATGSSSSLGKGLERRSLCSRYLFLGSSPLDSLLPLGHPFVRLPEIPSPNSESRPLTGRRPDGLGPTIYRLDSLVSSVAREREVDALCAARPLKGRKRGRERKREGERERERDRRLAEVPFCSRFLSLHQAMPFAWHNGPPIVWTTRSYRCSIIRTSVFIPFWFRFNNS